MVGYSELFGGYDGGQAEFLRVPYGNLGPRAVPEELTDEQVLFLTDILPTSYLGTLVNGGVKLS
ncbi:MAG: adhB [Herbinix sp.]|jgi:S-(hydroxymethyl)glutathione dehydrogenase/alcohol dehydrogenase|nr:adhB [Herbinix sp.]